jgi:hypothetical protein
MNKLAKLQLIGPVLLACTIIAAELATNLLGWMPSSKFAWYLNLEVFGVFQRSHYLLSDYVVVPYFQLLFVATPIVILACSGYAFRMRLAVAAASNLSCVYVFFLAYIWQKVGTPPLQAASLDGAASDSAFNLSALSLTFGPQTYILTALLATSLLSFTASHALYLGSVRKAA